MDQILPHTGTPAIASSMDASMMNFGVMERTERQWRETLVGVGLSVISLTLPSFVLEINAEQDVCVGPLAWGSSLSSPRPMPPRFALAHQLRG